MGNARFFPCFGVALVFDLAGVAPGLRQSKPQLSFPLTEIWKSSVLGSKAAEKYL